MNSQFTPQVLLFLHIEPSIQVTTAWECEEQKYRMVSWADFPKSPLWNKDAITPDSLQRGYAA